MIKLKQITIERAEGPTSLCGTKIAKTWEDAQHIINVNSQTAPKDYGYDKHDVTIEWEDGNKYKFRLDVYNSEQGEGLTSLVNEMNQGAEFYSGRHKPEHWTDSQYKHFLDEYVVVGTQFFKDLLEKYDMGTVMSLRNPVYDGSMGVFAE